MCFATNVKVGLVVFEGQACRKLEMEEEQPVPSEPKKKTPPKKAKKKKLVETPVVAAPVKPTPPPPAPDPGAGGDNAVSQSLTRDTRKYSDVTSLLRRVGDGQMVAKS